MTSTLFAVYERLVLAHPARVLVLMLAVLGFFAWQARHFELDASADSLLLEDDRDLQTLRELQTRYASQDLLIVTFAPGGDVFDEASLARLRALRDRLRTAPGVESVTSILDVPLLDNVEDVSLARGRRQPPHARRPGDGPRAGEGGTAREPGVRGSRRERGRADHRAPAHDAATTRHTAPCWRNATGCWPRGPPKTSTPPGAPQSTPSSKASRACTSPRSAA